MAEVAAHVLISIIATAVLAGAITLLSHAFNQDPEFLIVWLICFLGWWGIVWLGDC